MLTLARKSLQDLTSKPRDGLEESILPSVKAIMDDVQSRGTPALLEYAHKFGDLAPGAQLWYTKQDLLAEVNTLPTHEREVLERTATRIRNFAQAQRQSLQPLDIAIPGARAGHTIAPVDVAGCYAPGGRFPLPSTVLMTAVTARAAGVPQVIIASPKPTPATLAAAGIADADGLLAIGGVQAIAALTFGITPALRCDVIVGPGNKWVTAAKQLATRYTAIDMLAGPSEVLILADESANPDLIAADMLAQAEHDTDAIAGLVTTSPNLASKVEACLESQLATLSTASIARQSLSNNGYITVVDNTESAIAAADAVAAEHLEIMMHDAHSVAKRIRHYGAVFIGSATAEVLGDYGAGPNHVLPTGGMARSVGGLSVMNFLRLRTWLHMDESLEAQAIAKDAAILARMEGLEAHARAAELRA